MSNEVQYDEHGIVNGPSTFPSKWDKPIDLSKLGKKIKFEDIDDLCLTDEELAERRIEEAKSKVNFHVVPRPIYAEKPPDPARLANVDRKDMNGKHSPSLMPIEADVAFSKVSDHGLDKYGNRDTWKYSEPEEGIRRYLDAAIRHAKQQMQEGDLDPESGLPHVYSVLWNAAAAVWHYERTKQGVTKH